jgi:hypothetical protein
MASRAVRIGQVAEETGISIGRPFYEEQGLVEAIAAYRMH